MVVTPVACPDPPLLNHHGVHEPWFLRVIVRLRTDNGLEGVGEGPGRWAAHAAYMNRASAALGRDDVSAVRERHPDWLPHMPKW
jgi:glucarate dehydratase